MLQTNIPMSGSTANRDVSTVPAPVRLPGGGALAVRSPRLNEAAVDETLAESFPASDPPAWNSGIARPGPAGGEQPRRAGALPAALRDDEATAAPGVIDVSRPVAGERGALQVLISSAGAGGLALLVPFAILLAALPVALAVRGLLEVLQRLVPVLR